MESVEKPAYRKFMVSPIYAGIVLAFINVISYIYSGKPFTIYTGFYHVGASIYSALGLSNLYARPPVNPVYDVTAIGDLGLLIGAMFAAGVFNEFRIRRALHWSDYLESMFGGILMAVGVALSYGCNWGGFYSAITALSMHGFAMFVGLIIGGYIGQKYLYWKSEKLVERMMLRTDSTKISYGSRRSIYNVYIPITTSIVVATTIILYHLANGSKLLAGYLAIGFTVGFIIQRAGFCFATAFRDIIKGPEQRRARDVHLGIALGLFLSTTTIAILKYKNIINPMSYVSPVSIYNVVGGILFAIGFVMVGGCGSGALWRLGEGHLKVVPGLITTILMYPIAVRYIQPLSTGPKISPVILYGYEYGLLIVYALLALYVLFILTISKLK